VHAGQQLLVRLIVLDAAAHVEAEDVVGALPALGRRVWASDTLFGMTACIKSTLAELGKPRDRRGYPLVRRGQCHPDVL
jgi:hypothetical protein